ncbi:hypothetical protein ACFB49_38070 [Sphingomonas sp. DBB INV C78]|uniref:hypothetical protein n=1 Tax=Sphingomonas sp. DBB INV C78 TaxID=3349434 RepID=UPI0036D22F68
MRFLKIAAIFAALAPAVFGVAPASARTEWTESRFERDGEQYVVKTAQAGDTTRLKGYVVGTPVTFDLRVRGDRVSGTVNNRNVEFRRQDAPRLASR